MTPYEYLPIYIKITQNMYYHTPYFVIKKLHYYKSAICWLLRPLRLVNTQVKMFEMCPS